MPGMPGREGPLGMRFPSQVQGDSSGDGDVDGRAAETTGLQRRAAMPKVQLSWSKGNRLRLSYLQQEKRNQQFGAASVGGGGGEDDDRHGRVVEVRVGNSNEDGPAKRRLYYDSLPAFALIQSRKQSHLHPEEGRLPSDWWETVLEYSRSISAVLGPRSSYSGTASKQLFKLKKDTQGPTLLKAIWDLLEIFYVDKHALSWLPEQLVDWLQSYDRVLSRVEPTVYMQLACLQLKLSNMRLPEDDVDYWDGIASALAVGWLDIVVKLLRMHGSYQHDQIDDRQTENGLVEAVAVLISKMPRLRPSSANEDLGLTYSFKPEFSKAWEKWHNQIAKLNGSTFWFECSHKGTLAGLKRLIQVCLGDIDTLAAATKHWMELLVSHFLFIRPFSVVSEGMLSLARRCTQLKPPSKDDELVELILAIIGENIEVLLLECTKLFDPWMLAHMTELLTARNLQAQARLSEEKDILGGISLLELHKLVYAQLLSSHPCTWQLAPLYLAACPRQGRGLLENLLLMQPVCDHSRLSLKVLDICRMYDLHMVAEKIMRSLGVHNWKHGRKGTGILWLQRAHDSVRLSAAANELLSSVFQAAGDPSSLQEFEGLIDLLGPQFEGFGGLTFLHRYKDFKMSLHKFQEIKSKDAGPEKALAAGKDAAKHLMQLLHGAVTPHQFVLPLLRESVLLLEFQGDVLLNVAETNALLSKLQSFLLSDVSIEQVKSSESMDKLRLALARNLARAIQKE